MPGRSTQRSRCDSHDRSEHGPPQAPDSTCTRTAWSVHELRSSAASDWTTVTDSGNLRWGCLLARWVAASRRPGVPDRASTFLYPTLSRVAAKLRVYRWARLHQIGWRSRHERAILLAATRLPWKTRVRELVVGNWRAATPWSTANAVDRSLCRRRTAVLTHTAPDTNTTNTTVATSFDGVEPSKEVR